MKKHNYEVFTVDKLDEALEYSKRTYCRYFTILCYPKIAVQSVLLDNLVKCKREEYSVVGIKHDDTRDGHFHFVVGFTSSYNQKKCIYQVMKELGFKFRLESSVEFIDFMNHIRPVSNIKEALLYLTHSSKGAIADNKKPYRLSDCFIAKNGNDILFERLRYYMSDLYTITDDDWSISDAGRYIYNLVITYHFRDQYELQRYVVFDDTITDNQRNKVLSNWRNFIFAVQREFTANSRKFEMVDKETFQKMENYILSIKGDLDL